MSVAPIRIPLPPVGSDTLFSMYTLAVASSFPYNVPLDTAPEVVS